MASVSKRTDRPGYVVRWRDAAGRQRKLSFVRKVDADRKRAEIEHSMNVGAYVDPQAGRVTLREYAEKRWLPAQVHLRPNSVTLYRQQLARHVLPALGRRPVASVTRVDVKSLIAALGTTLAPATVGSVYAVLRGLMAGAVDDGLIVGSPCTRVPLPTIEPAVLTLPTAAQVQAVAAVIVPRRFEVAVWLAAGAGLREGEALGLLAERVRFLERRILVEEQAQAGRLVPLKTRASKAAVPIDDLVLAKVSAHLAAYPVNGTGLLVTNNVGRMVQRSSFGRSWRTASAATGLAGCRFHDLRHFYASTLIAAGLHPKVIQARLRHSTISETMDRYGHLFPEAESAGRGALDAAFAPQPSEAVAPRKRPRRSA